MQLHAEMRELMAQISELKDANVLSADRLSRAEASQAEGRQLHVEVRELMAQISELKTAIVLSPDRGMGPQASQANGHRERWRHSPTVPRGEAREEGSPQLHAEMRELLAQITELQNASPLSADRWAEVEASQANGERQRTSLADGPLRRREPHPREPVDSIRELFRQERPPRHGRGA